VCLTRPAHNSRTNSRRIIKIGSKVAHDMSNIAAVIAPRQGHTVMAEPGGHTSCFDDVLLYCVKFSCRSMMTNIPSTGANIELGYDKYTVSKK